MTTAAGRRLTEAHRLGQIRNTARLTAFLASIRDQLNPDDYARWLTGATAATVASYRASATLAAAYLAELARAETGAVGPAVALPTPTLEAIQTSLIVTGPVTLARYLAEERPDPRGAALYSVSRSASRHAVTGGRDLIRDAGDVDDRIVGFRRVTDSDPCGYCSSRASAAAAGDDRAAFGGHDGCHCQPRPIYG